MVLLVIFKHKEKNIKDSQKTLALLSFDTGRTKRLKTIRLFLAYAHFKILAGVSNGCKGDNFSMDKIEEEVLLELGTNDWFIDVLTSSQILTYVCSVGCVDTKSQSKGFNLYLLHLLADSCLDEAWDRKSTNRPGWAILWCRSPPLSWPVQANSQCSAISSSNNKLALWSCWLLQCCRGISALDSDINYLILGIILCIPRSLSDNYQYYFA
ncbi:hypothetical protein Tco_1378445 [Tanacetum coccineum]